MPEVTVHREVRKELDRLPASVRTQADLVIGRLVANPTDPEIVHKMERGWGRRRVYVAAMSGPGGQYRLAWEVVGDRVIVWMAGPHEGFYGRLDKRAKR